jgi:hypothetical protein
MLSAGNMVVRLFNFKTPLTSRIVCTKGGHSELLTKPTIVLVRNMITLIF